MRNVASLLVLFCLSAVPAFARPAPNTNLVSFTNRDFVDTYGMIGVTFSRDALSGEVFVQNRFATLNADGAGGLEMVSTFNDLHTDTNDDNYRVTADGSFFIEDFPGLFGVISGDTKTFFIVIDTLSDDTGTTENQIRGSLPENLQRASLPENVVSEFLVGTRKIRQDFRASDLSGTYIVSVLVAARTFVGFYNRTVVDFDIQRGAVFFDGTGTLVGNLRDQENNPINFSETYTVTSDGKVVISDTGTSAIWGHISDDTGLFLGVGVGDRERGLFIIGHRESDHPLTNRDLFGVYKLAGLTLVSGDFALEDPGILDFTDEEPFFGDMVDARFFGGDTVSLIFFGEEGVRETEEDTYLVNNLPARGRFVSGYDPFDQRHLINGMIGPNRSVFSITNNDIDFPGIMIGIKSPRLTAPQDVALNDTLIEFIFDDEDIDDIRLEFDPGDIPSGAQVTTDLLRSDQMDSGYKKPFNGCIFLGGFELIFSAVIISPDSISIVYTYTDTALAKAGVAESSLIPFVYNNPDTPEDVVSFQLFPDENKLVIVSPHFSTFIVGASGAVSDPSGAGSGCVIENRSPAFLVPLLRAFRDELLGASWGRKLISRYYAE